MNVYKQICKLAPGEYVFTNFIYTHVCIVYEDKSAHLKRIDFPNSGSIYVIWEIENNKIKIRTQSSVGGIFIREEDSYLSADKLRYVCKLSDYNYIKLKKLWLNVLINSYKIDKNFMRKNRFVIL